MFAVGFVCAASLQAVAQKDRKDKKESPPTPQEIIVVAPPQASVMTKALERDIRRLLEVSNVIERNLNSIDPLFENYKRSLPSVPKDVWEDLKREFKAEFNADVIAEMYVPIYARHFTPEEVKKMLAFYESPVGRKMITEMPLVEADAYIAGFERGRTLQKKVWDKLRARGFQVPVT